MFCPKCGADLKDGAKFCHKCGNNMGDGTPVTPQQQPVQPQQPATPGQGFDMSKTPMSSWIYAGVAFTGVICTFLPWYTVTYSFGYWGGGSVSVNGLHSFLGVLSLLVFLGLAGVAIVGTLIGLKSDAIEKIMKFAPLGAAFFCLIDLIRFIAQSEGYGRPGFGLIVALIMSVGLILFGFKVIKLK